MGVELGDCESLDFRIAGESPPLAVVGMVISQLKGKFAATLMVKVCPSGIAAQRLQMAAGADLIDISGSGGGITCNQIGLGAEKQTVCETDDRIVDPGSRESTT